MLRKLFERMLSQSGNNFSFPGLSCCEVLSTNNFIQEKKFSDFHALIPQPNSLHEKLGRQFCFLLQVFFFLNSYSNEY